MQQQTLANRTIALPETRELDVFASLLERRGAVVLRCPLVSICDAPDPAPVIGWIEAFNNGACDDLILLTGEGLHRLLGCIDKNAPELRPSFLDRLAKVRKITRGPKPARALRELKLKPDIEAQTPTTEGVIASLREHALTGRSIGVQLYGIDPNARLVGFLQDAGARVLPVAPYIYAENAADDAVRGLLSRMSAGEVDVIAFTSAAQVERLFAVAPVEVVAAALGRTQVAAIGPIVAEALARRAVTVRMMPSDSYFMKPLANAMAEGIGPKTPLDG